MIPYNKQVHIISGGTVHHIRPHFALAAMAYGKTGYMLEELCRINHKSMDVSLHQTKMAGGSRLETNEDVERLVNELILNPLVKIIFMPVALCDWELSLISQQGIAGKYGTRLKSTDSDISLRLVPAKKIISTIRKERKDIFLVGFKTTSGFTEDQQYIAGLNLVKKASCNLVFANDIVTRRNMVITPEEARYHVSLDRGETLKGLVEMAYLRSQLTFTQSTVVRGDPINWDSPEIPNSLRIVVNWLINKGAYKAFKDATAGHFAVKLNDTTFLTSRRKTNFNNLARDGLVKIVTDGPDTVLAYGAKPSVGGQSQRIVFRDHPGYDCIVHMHCPKKPESLVPTISQRENECGSHECGQATSRGLKEFWVNNHKDEKHQTILAVYLEEHGPNIVFNQNVNPQEVIDFIEANFDLSKKTGGPVNVTT